jgi:hypothetical protein
MRVLPLVVLIAAGCSPSPCDGKGPMCISLRVEGSTPPLATLAFESSINQADPVYTPVTDPNPYYLPVRLAVMLPANTTGSVALSVEGTDGEGRRYADSVAVSVPPSGQDVTVKLVMTGPK